MRSTPDPAPVTHAVGWRRVTNAILVCSVLLVFAAANTAHAAVTGAQAASTTISVLDPMAHAADLNVVANSVTCADHAARSVPPRHASVHGVNDTCPFEPDLWLDDEDDDDDDDEVGRHGSASRRSAFSVEEALGLRRSSRALGGSVVPDGSLPVNLFLSESARRM